MARAKNWFRDHGQLLDEDNQAKLGGLILRLLCVHWFGMARAPLDPRSPSCHRALGLVTNPVSLTRPR
jgi:hypothetical protein